MDRLEERAARWGIETEYWDGLGRRHRVAPETLTRLLGVLACGGEDRPLAHGSTPIIHRRAFQAEEAPRRMWAIAAQLYGVRSRRNWGHGDFTDLKGLLKLAAEFGASGVGLNPLYVCRRLYMQRGDLVAMRAVIFTAISERGK